MQNNRRASKRLISAVSEGRIERVRELISSFGACSLLKQPGGYDLLLCAVANKHTEIANLLLAKGCNVNSIKETRDDSPLHHAAGHGEVELVRMLLDKGAIIDVKNIIGETPLHNAVISRKIKIVQLLLNKGANVNNTNKRDVTPLHLAAQYGTTDILQLLLRNGANVNAERHTDRWMPLHIAINGRQEEVAKLLISCGADVNARDRTGKTPIFYAIDNGDLKITKLLLANKANIKDDPDLLTNATKKAHKKIVDVLLQHGADINSSDIYGRTALHFTALSNFREVFGSRLDKDPNVNIRVEFAKLLLSRGADVNAETKDGVTALYAAAYNGYAKVVMALLEYNADVNFAYTSDLKPFSLFVQKSKPVDNATLSNIGAVTNTEQKNRMTALHIATYMGHKEVVELLLTGGSKIDSKIRHDMTPLRIAVLKGHVEIVKILLDLGASINSKDEYGGTALHVASQRGQPEIVIALLDHGSDVTIMNGDHDTAFHLAEDGMGSFHKLRYNSDFGNEYFLGLGNNLVVYNNFDDYCNSDGYSYDSAEECSSYAQDDIYNLDCNSGSDDDSYDHDLDPHEHIIRILKCHMIKVKTANLYASNEDLLFISSDDEEMSRFQNECEQEVASMRSEKVGKSSLSFYDVLTKSIRQLATYAGNKSMVEVFRSSDWKVKFPIYDSMINTQFRKGRRRKELLDESYTIFNFFFNNFLGLPYCCTEKIFSYLSDEDLRTLLHACRPISASSPT